MMINGSVTHPEVLSALARSGHTSKVLIADGHFPSATLLGPNVPRVFLNFAPGLLSVSDVLGPLLHVVEVQDAVAATFEDGSKPPIWEDYLRLLPPHVELGSVKGSELTSAFGEAELGLVILTGELRAASCIVLTLGLRKSQEPAVSDAGVALS
jgi:L-fucose mutarotase